MRLFNRSQKFEISKRKFTRLDQKISDKPAVHQDTRSSPLSWLRREKTLDCQILLLDGSDIKITLDRKAYGEDLLDRVFAYLDLIEKDYFGLQFMDHLQVSHWLDPSKLIKKQVKIGPPYTLSFRVKFYSSEPNNLREELTRYQFFLQLKRDILTGKLPCPYDTAVELAAYALQSELGDFNPEEHTPTFISEFRFVPDQTENMELDILQVYKEKKNQTPAQAEINYLTKVKWLDLYGVDFHTVLGKDGFEYSLGLTPTGVLVFERKQKIGLFLWPKINRFDFRNKKVILVVEEDEYVEQETPANVTGDSGPPILIKKEHTFVFRTYNYKAAKHLWKCAVQYHTFFRLIAASSANSHSSSTLNGHLTAGNNKIAFGTLRATTTTTLGGIKANSFFRMGSRFRYSGKTEFQATFQSKVRKSMQIERKPSQRYSRRPVKLAAPTLTISSPLPHLGSISLTEPALDPNIGIQRPSTDVEIKSICTPADVDEVPNSVVETNEILAEKSESSDLTTKTFPETTLTTTTFKPKSTKEGSNSYLVAKGTYYSKMSANPSLIVSPMTACATFFGISQQTVDLNGDVQTDFLQDLPGIQFNEQRDEWSHESNAKALPEISCPPATLPEKEEPMKLELLQYSPKFGIKKITNPASVPQDSNNVPLEAKPELNGNRATGGAEKTTNIEPGFTATQNVKNELILEETEKPEFRNEPLISPILRPKAIVERKIEPYPAKIGDLQMNGTDICSGSEGENLNKRDQSDCATPQKTVRFNPDIVTHLRPASSYSYTDDDVKTKIGFFETQQTSCNNVQNDGPNHKCEIDSATPISRTTAKPRDDMPSSKIIYPKEKSPIKFAKTSPSNDACDSMQQPSKIPKPHLLPPVIPVVVKKVVGSVSREDSLPPVVEIKIQMNGQTHSQDLEEPEEEEFHESQDTFEHLEDSIIPTLAPKESPLRTLRNGIDKACINGIQQHEAKHDESNSKVDHSTSSLESSPICDASPNESKISEKFVVNGNSPGREKARLPTYFFVPPQTGDGSGCISHKNSIEPTTTHDSKNQENSVQVQGSAGAKKKRSRGKRGRKLPGNSNPKQMTNGDTNRTNSNQNSLTTNNVQMVVVDKKKHIITDI